MKPYEELYDKYKAKTGQVVNYDSFIEALTEHDREIKEKIKGMIIRAKIFQHSKYKVVPFTKANVVAGQVKTLTELLNFMELKWKQ